MGTWTSFPEGEEADRIIRVVSRLRINGALPPVLLMPLRFNTDYLRFSFAEE